MRLPEYIASAIAALEGAGFAAYCVGGCVRDSLLGLTPHDYDLCTNALPAQIRQVFSDFQLVLAGEKHGTVSVVTPQGLIEITTFRTEGGYTDTRHPDWVRFVPTIEEDLSRRDFTVNAMAFSPTRGFADPFGGRDDLKAGILRCVGEPEKRFILQPMTKSEALIKWLCDNGFEIIGQDCCVAAGKCYTVILARYCGEKIKADELFYYLGRLRPNENETHLLFVRGHIARLKKQARGEARFGALANRLEEIING